MSFFRHLAFSSWFRRDVIDNHFLDAQTDKILNEIDEEYRFKEVNELTYPDREIRTNLLYAATTFWTYVINASNTLYKKIQILEADYSKVKSELDNKLHYVLVDYENKRKALEEEISAIDVELEEYNVERKKIEASYFVRNPETSMNGSLNRIAPWVFLVVMVIAGLAELFMYKNVFMSQEIGFIADMSEETKFHYELMALGMATGFTAMIIWLAHKMGEILRHLDSANRRERNWYIVKFVFIAAVTSAAITATVKIRGDMHHILAIDQQIDQLQEAREDAMAQKMFGDDEAGSGDTDESADNAGGFGEEDEAGDETGFGEGGFGDEEGFDEQENSTVSMTDSSKNSVESVNPEQRLRDQEISAKGSTAWLFSVINFFIVVGGVFLSYETHTSSKVYETIEKQIKRLEKRKHKREKALLRLDGKIEKFKHNTIDKLFNELLYRAALYDKEVRTYNTYLQIFEFKMQLVEDYLKNIYEAKGVAFKEIHYKEILDEKINLDFRYELHHVNDIEEYLIYKTDKEGENKDV